MYLIQLYVIKFVSDQQLSRSVIFSGYPVSSKYKTDHYYIRNSVKSNIKHPQSIQSYNFHVPEHSDKSVTLKAGLGLWCILPLSTDKLYHSFTYLPKSQIQTNFLFIQTNSFIIFTCQNPVFLVPSFGQVGQREDWCCIKYTLS